jgi:hypothetical protein
MPTQTDKQIYKTQKHTKMKSNVQTKTGVTFSNNAYGSFPSVLIVEIDGP